MRSGNPFGARRLRVVRPAGDADIVGALEAPPDPPAAITDDLQSTEHVITITGLPDRVRLNVTGVDPAWSTEAWGDELPDGPEPSMGLWRATVRYDAAHHVAWVRMFSGRVRLELVAEGPGGCTALHRMVELDIRANATTDASSWTLLAPGSDACVDAARPPAPVTSHGVSPQTHTIVGPRPYVLPIDPVTGKPVTDGEKKPAAKGNGMLWAAAIALGLGGLWYATKE